MKKTWDPSPFRQQHMTCWPRSHPVRFPPVHTDHWTKMKTRVPTYLSSMPATMIERESPNGIVPIHSSQLLLPVTQNMSGTTPNNPTLPWPQGMSLCSRRAGLSVQNLSHYRNQYNDNARRGFRYWLIEKKPPNCNGCSFGAYKTSLGLPRV